MFENFRHRELPLAFITIETEKIKEFAKQLNPDNFIVPEWSEEVFLINDSQEDIDFIYLINTINFSYWPDPGKEKWTVDFNGKNYSGSMALFAALKKALINGYPLFDPFYLKDLPEAELKIILSGTAEVPMLQERLNILKNVGKSMIDNNIRNLSDFSGLAGGSAIRLIEKLIRFFPSFDDSFYYKQEKFNFFKRAQLICAMLYGRYKGKGPGSFNDIDNLTVFADYRVPQTIRKLGFLTYEASLAGYIENNIYLKEGSPEELEIRISCILACELLKEFTAEIYGPGCLNSLSLDYYLWKAGKDITEPDFNFHKTRTVFY